MTWTMVKTVQVMRRDKDFDRRIKGDYQELFLDMNCLKCLLNIHIKEVRAGRFEFGRQQHIDI